MSATNVTTYLLRRLMASLLTLLLSSMVVFLLLRAVPGDIVQLMLGQATSVGGGGEELLTSMRAFFGLDQPLYIQYLDWICGVFQGDFGDSWRHSQPVRGIVLDAFLVTLQVSVLTLLLATIVGVALGFAAGIYEGTPVDTMVQAFSILGLSAPLQWVGLMLLAGVSTYLSWGPPVIYLSPMESLTDNVAILALPITALVVLNAAAYSQLTRQLVVSAAHEEFVRTAIAKGLPQRTVYFKHILRNILIPLVTFMGVILIYILGGVVVIEEMFSLPGIGRLLLTSLQNRDYPVVQGALLLIVFVALFINLVVDFFYHVIDPRIRI